MKHIKKGGNTRHRPFGRYLFILNMRRKDREITEQNEIIKIITECQVLNLGLANDNDSYVVPVNFAFELVGDKKLFYFHSAKAGKKIAMIEKNNHCSFVLYNDLGVVLKKERNSATNYYRCVMGKGKIREIKELSQKRHAAEKLLVKYKCETELTLSDEALDNTYIAEIVVEEMTAKANQGVKK